MIPWSLGGLKIVPAMTWPKLQLGAAAPVSDECRAEFNAWLVERFGFTSLVPRGQALRFGDVVVMRPEDIQRMTFNA